MPMLPEATISVTSKKQYNKIMRIAMGQDLPFIPSSKQKEFLANFKFNDGATVGL